MNGTQYVPDDLKDDKYWARRRKNNMAAKRSRDARRVKENQIAMRAAFLEKEVVSAFLRFKKKILIKKKKKKFSFGLNTETEGRNNLLFDCHELFSPFAERRSQGRIGQNDEIVHVRLETSGTVRKTGQQQEILKAPPPLSP